MSRNDFEEKGYKELFDQYSGLMVAQNALLIEMMRNQKHLSEQLQLTVSHLTMALVEKRYDVMKNDVNVEEHDKFFGGTINE